MPRALLVRLGLCTTALQHGKARSESVWLLGAEGNLGSPVSASLHLNVMRAEAGVELVPFTGSLFFKLPRSNLLNKRGRPVVTWQDCQHVHPCLTGS